jgi:hypothetical protein
MRIEATPPVIRVEGIRIDTPRPVHEALSHSARLQLADQRLRSHQGVLGTPVEPPLQAIRPFDGNGEALPEVFREPRMEAGREVEPLAAQPLTDPDSERTFRGNVDGVRTERDQAIDRPPRVPRQPYLRIRRHGHRLVAVRGDDEDGGPERLEVPDEPRESVDDAVGLRVPRVGHEGEPRDALAFEPRRQRERHAALEPGRVARM